MATDAPTNVPAVSPRRRYLRFSLRTLLVAITVTCLWLGWVVNSGVRQRRAIDDLEELGLVNFEYEWEVDERGEQNWHLFEEPESGPKPPAEWHYALGVDFFHTVVAATGFLATDDSLFRLRDLPHLRRLEFDTDETASSGALKAKGWGELARLRGLRVLNLGTSETSDETLTAVGALRSLEELALVVNKDVTAEGFSHLAALTNLRSLAVSFKEDYSPQQVAECLRQINSLARLEDLVLSFPGDSALGCFARGQTPPALRRVVLVNCPALTRTGLSSIAAMASLEFVSLEDCGEVTLEGFPRLSELRHLSVSGCRRIVTSQLADLANLPALRMIQMRSLRSDAASEPSGHALGRPGEWWIFGCEDQYFTSESTLATVSDDADATTQDARFARLQFLLLDAVDRFNLGHLDGMNHLVDLTIQNCEEITRHENRKPKLPALHSLVINNSDPYVLSLLSNASGLEKLVIVGDRGPDDESFAYVAALNNLEKLSLLDLPDLTNAALRDVAKCACLKSLTMRKLRITGEAFEQLAALNLESLSLYTCQHLRTNALALLAGCKTLETLDVSGCITLDLASFPDLAELTTLKLSDESMCNADVAALVAACPKLRSLTFSNCLLTDDGLAVFATLSTLEVFDVSACDKLTDDGLQTLASVRGLKELVVPHATGEPALKALQTALPECNVHKPPRASGFSCVF